MTTRTLAVLEAVKKDIESGAYSVLPARYGAICDLIDACKADLAKKAAKSAGKTDLLKACKSVLKSANKTYNSALHGVTVINDRAFVCDNYRIISYPAGAVDLPLLDTEKVKPLDFARMMDHGVFAIEAGLPTAGYLDVEIKRVKAAEKAAGRKPSRIAVRVGDMFFNAEYLKDAILATGATTGGAVNEKSPLFLEKDGVTAVVMPINPGTITQQLDNFECGAIC